MGVDLAQEDKLVDAIAIFHEAVRMDRNDAYAYYNLGYTMLLEGKTDEAVRLLEQAVHLKPDDPSMLNKLNEALRTKNN